MGRIEARRERLQREQDELDAALAEWVRIPDAASTARLMKAARAYLGISD